MRGITDARANEFIEHPSRDAPGAVVGKFDINDVTLTASATEDLQFLTEQRMIGIENLCGF
ncbi:MAG: hypothetical protein WCO84_08650 [bacterium]